MRARRTLSAALLLLSGCAGTHAPKDWLPNASEATTQAHGGWVVVRLADRSMHEGELIAIGPDSLFVLEAAGCRGYAQTQVEHGLLTGYDSEADRLQAWVVLGSLSTLSHGYWLIATLPVWLLAGSLETSAQAHAGRVSITPTTWEKARLYARFPQGLPEGLDRAAVRPRDPPPRIVTR